MALWAGLCGGAVSAQSRSGWFVRPEFSHGLFVAFGDQFTPPHLQASLLMGGTGNILASGYWSDMLFLGGGVEGCYYLLDKPFSPFAAARYCAQWYTSRQEVGHAVMALIGISYRDFDLGIGYLHRFNSKTGSTPVVLHVGYHFRF